MDVKKKAMGLIELRELAEILVGNRDVPPYLLDPLEVILNTNMSKYKENRLLTEGINAVNLFFDTCSHHAVYSPG